MFSRGPGHAGTSLAEFFLRLGVDGDKASLAIHCQNSGASDVKRLDFHGISPPPLTVIGAVFWFSRERSPKKL